MEVKHLWRQNGCATKYQRHLLMRIDDFQKPALTSVLCSNWKEWEEPIICQMLRLQVIVCVD
ncbi:hypothetical protein DCAR_0312688 [Daucus carota subsp. sativus]|uniref:Uncharacterized protein n=1 Tax=Daucus carota subsp. sativus TaxID=79200 RepID=A0AAF1AS56_DAUCS|nr:hypothetical protein DCAR_0312688 [Daucus carota subsp. sativus]